MAKIRTLSQHSSFQAVPLAGRRRHALSPLFLDSALAAVILLIGLAARLYGLGDKPYWLDEVTTLHRASLAPAGMIVDSLSFHHLPLYFLISRWFLAFGSDEASLRLPAALFGALSCAILFGLARMIGGRRAAIGASMLLALSPFQVQYGQEARSYTLVISFILIALWALCWLARNPDQAARPLRERGFACAGWLAYGAATLGALDTLSVALFWLLAGILAIGLCGLREPTYRRGFLTNAIIVHALVLACYLPWIAAMHVLTHGDMGSGLDWVPPLNWRRFWTTVQAVYLMRTTSLIRFQAFPDGLPWFGLLTAIAAGAGLAQNRGRDPAIPTATIALVTLPLGLLITSLFSSVWMPRYLAWSGPVFYLFAGLGAARLRRLFSWGALALLFCAGTLNLLPYYRLETKPLWNQAALEVSADLPSNGLLLTDNVADINMMNVSLGRLGAPLAPGLWTSNINLALRHLRNGMPVLAVHGRVGQADHTSVASFDRFISPLGTPCWSRSIGLDIVIREYAPSKDSCAGLTPP